MTVSQGLRSDSTMPSKFVQVLGAEMHYLDTGSGDPMLFVHGIPTSAQIWRHIMPAFAEQARCIAPDLIGFGQSSKPAIAYSVEDHYRYLCAFIEALDLDRITLVLHGWGSVPGLQYAAQHEKKIKSIVLYEPHIRPVTDCNMLSLPVQQLAALLRNEAQAKRAIIDDNFFVERWLRMGAVDKLDSAVLDMYRQPFANKKSRQPLWQYAQELPIGNRQTPALQMIQNYNHWLRQTAMPVCLLYAVPGMITPIETVAWAKDNIEHIKLVELDDAMHFIQECQPQRFIDALLSVIGD